MVVTRGPLRRLAGNGPVPAAEASEREDIVNDEEAEEVEEAPSDGDEEDVLPEEREKKDIEGDWPPEAQEGVGLGRDGRLWPDERLPPPARGGRLPRARPGGEEMTPSPAPPPPTPPPPPPPAPPPLVWLEGTER